MYKKKMQTKPKQQNGLNDNNWACVSLYNYNYQLCYLLFYIWNINLIR